MSDVECGSALIVSVSTNLMNIDLDPNQDPDPRDEDGDLFIFGHPELLLFSLDPDPTCNGFLRLFSS